MVSSGPKEDDYVSSSTDDDDEEGEEESSSTPSISSEGSSVESSESTAEAKVQVGPCRSKLSQHSRKSDDRLSGHGSQATNGSKERKSRNSTSSSQRRRSPSPANRRQLSSQKKSAPSPSSSKTPSKRKRQTRTPEVISCDDSSEADFSFVPAAKKLKETKLKKEKIRTKTPSVTDSETDSAVEPSDEEEQDTTGEEAYEVEHILKHQLVSETRKGKTYEYLIKWKDYAHHHNSWEPESNLRGAPKLLDAYWKKHDKKQAEAQWPERKPGRPRKSESNESAKGKGTASAADAMNTEDSEVEYVDNNVHAVPLEGTPKRSQTIVRRRSTPPEEDCDEIDTALPLQPVCRAQEGCTTRPGEWTDSVTAVIGSRGSFTGKDLNFCLQFRSGEERWVASREAYEKCPMTMLHFYESLLSLRYMDENGREVVVLRDGREQES